MKTFLLLLCYNYHYNCISLVRFITKLPLDNVYVMTFASKICRTRYNVPRSTSSCKCGVQVRVQVQPRKSEVRNGPSVKCRASFSKWRMRLVNKVAGF